MYTLSCAIDGLDLAPDYPDLVGKRVLVTGVCGSLGMEVTRLFADHRTRMVILADEESPESHAIAEIVAQTAMDVRLYSGPMQVPDEIARFTRAAVQCYGGIDAVINLAALGDCEDGSANGVERFVSETLAQPCLVSRIVANRMRTTLTQGTILNVVAAPRDATARQRALGGVVRSALATLTRNEAQEWSRNGIRVNAIAPSQSALAAGPSCISSAPDVASLAVHLASEHGTQLSGLIFEAYCG